MSVDFTSLPEWVRPGVSFRWRDRLYHVRGVIDDYAVLREWWPSKKRWNYTCECWVFFQACVDNIELVTSRHRAQRSNPEM